MTSETRHRIDVDVDSGADALAVKGAVQALVADYSMETTPRGAKKIDRFGDLLPVGTRVYVPHLPASSWDDTVALAARLRKEGMDPVPHIVARRMETVALLDETLGRFVGEAGVTCVLVVAGDTKPLGELDSALQILEMGILDKHGIRKVNVAGHPEGHRVVADEVLRDALVRKNAWARRTGAEMNVVTQFGFSADPIVAWEAGNGPDVDRLPYIVGSAGLATMKTLLRFALETGVGPSVRALSRHARNLAKLLTVAAPDNLIVALARHRLRTPDTRLAGVHFFPFGGLKRTAAWVNKIVEGDFELSGDGAGLTVA